MGCLSSRNPASSGSFFAPAQPPQPIPQRAKRDIMSVVIDGQDNQDAAWYYPDPKPAARKVKGYVAFWRGVEVEK